MSIDIEQDIFDSPLDNDEANREEKKLLPDAGWWVTEAPLVLTPKVNEEGRKMARYFGTLVNPKTGKSTKLGFGFSPDVRYKDGEETADFSYRLFLSARKAYKDATGVDPATVNDVVRFIEQQPVGVRIIHTPTNEALAVNFRAVRE